MKKYLLYFALHYPKSEIEDYIKMIHQSEYHLNETITNDSYAFLVQEYEKAIPNSKFLYEYISEDVVRVNLGNYKASEFSLHYLFDSFKETINNNQGSIENMDEKLALLLDLIKSKEIALDYDDSLKKIENYKKLGYPAIHHSEAFKKAYDPHYRIIQSSNLTPGLKDFHLFYFLDNLIKEKNKLIIAIDGRSSSGKTTVALTLKKKYNATIIHIDHFFLPNFLKTKERLAEIGGNINYEEIEKVLREIKHNTTYTYQAFDCKVQEYYPVTIETSNLIVFEGVYSLHEKLFPYYDTSVLLTLCKKEQISRLKQRETPAIYLQFLNEWIPLENEYFTDNLYKKIGIII